MSWLERIRPSLKFFQKKDTPDHLWAKCRGCGQMNFHRELVDNLNVCPRCDFHERIDARTRFQQVFDAGWRRLPTPAVTEDPLKFRDQKKYADRLKAARAATGEADAFVVGEGRIGGVPAVVGIQNFAFMGGSMGMGVGEAFIAGAEAALAHGVPYVVFTAAGGARMQEGLLSLMQMPRTTVMTSLLREAGIPYVVVLTDPTTGGVTASYAMLGDVHIAEPGALIGFAGQRVIEQTIREKLPEGFQRAEYLLEHGMVDMVVHRRDIKKTLAQLLGVLTKAPAKAA
jgi:acetyl-CoA carboxylase carboxyl transferase subunit beta